MCTDCAQEKIGFLPVLLLCGRSVQGLPCALGYRVHKCIGFRGSSKIGAPVCGRPTMRTIVLGAHHIRSGHNGIGSNVFF